MSNFKESFEEVIGLEGGYSNDSNDKGGETKWGISKRWYPNVDIKNLTRDGAEQIYWENYWNPLRLPLVEDDNIATEIFEQAINMGKAQASLHAQWSINLVDPEAHINPDGWMGPATAAALNRLGQRRKTPFLKCANGFQFIRYLEIVNRDPTQKKYFVGWLKRISYV